MSIYTRAIYFKNGDMKTITDKEFEDVKQLLISGHQWVQVQGSLISADTIARLDNHHATAQMKKENEAEAERLLIMEGKGKLVDAKRAIQEKEAIANALHEQRVIIGKEYEEMIKKIQPKDEPLLERTGMTNDEVMRGEPAYYLNEHGEKMYS